MSKVKAARTEGAEAHSPGHRPVVKVSQIPMRPVRAKALIINAFALAGRFAFINPYRGCVKTEVRGSLGFARS